MRISDWSSDVCSSDLVDPARPFHLAHMIDQILRVVSLIAALRLVAVFQPRLAPRGLGDALRLRVFVVLLAVASLGGICFGFAGIVDHGRSEEHTSELQSLMRIPYAVFCLKNTTETRCS